MHPIIKPVHFIVWADNAKFPTGEKTNRSQLPAHIADEIVLPVQQFRSGFKGAAMTLCLGSDHFSLHHADSYHCNIIINDLYNILSIIHWGGVLVVPWEVMELPAFLYTSPSPIDLPLKYSCGGYSVGWVGEGAACLNRVCGEAERRKGS
jgi:hypothetical protein